MSALSPAALELLAAVERGDIVRMPDGATWDVKRGSYRDRATTEDLRAAGFITVERVESPQVDRTYVLTDDGRAALATAREEKP
jgi:hypothetical protein